MKMYLLAILFFVSIFSYGQGFIVETDNENQFLKYRNTIYEPIWSKKLDVIGVNIDTINVCRIKQSKIKNLHIYYFKNQTDSILLRSYTYDTMGYISSMEPEIGWYNITKPYVVKSPINCRIVKYNGRNEKKTKYHILKGFKESFKYDQLGYLTQYTKTKLGVINRMLTRSIGGGTVKYITFYEYNKDHSIVTISYCHSDRLSSENCTPLYFDYVTCMFDTSGNLVSEIKYKYDSKNLSIIVEGYGYIYEYFK